MGQAAAGLSLEEILALRAGWKSGDKPPPKL
eukprot:SAG22_NODE_19737_length_272_cov_0.595376_1_plen_30_part_01